MRFLPSLLLVALAGCGEELPEPSYRYGTLLPELDFEVTDPDMGIHPNQSILRDPNTPFTEGISLEGKFLAFSDNPIAGFYAMGTALVYQPTGEHQFYTAFALEYIYYGDDQHIPEDPALVRDMALRAYQSVLDNFPGSLTYDAAGRPAFELGPAAIDGIERLGGTVQNGWHKVQTDDGSFTAVQNQ
jgi:hypothetical protein